MEQEKRQFRCSGNCLNCQPQQRAYCACQHAYSNMKVLDAVMEAVMAMQDDMKKLSEKVEALQNNEVVIFDPNEESPIEEDTAQKGDGAKE